MVFSINAIFGLIAWGAHKMGWKWVRLGAIVLAAGWFIVWSGVILKYTLDPPYPYIPMSCMTMGCPDQLDVILVGNVPARYDLTITAKQSRLSLSCRHGEMVPGSLARVNAGDGILAPGFDTDTTRCTVNGAYIDGFVPYTFKATVQWNDEKRARWFRPQYEWYEGRCCLYGKVTMEIR
jgi:hypothetical protein